LDIFILLLNKYAFALQSGLPGWCVAMLGLGAAHCKLFIFNQRLDQ
jgi:hypothetical protein